MRRQIQALQPDRAIGQHRRRGSERKPLSLSNPTSILCWSEADAAVVGWSDGAVEVLDCSFVHREKRQGNKRNRIALFKSSANHSPVSSIAMLHFQTRKRRALPSGNSHRQQQPSVAATLDAVQHEALNRVGERGIAPASIAGAPVSELTGPWGGPMRFRRTETKQRKAQEAQSQVAIESHLCQRIGGWRSVGVEL